MVSFSLRGFKEHLNQNIEKSELRFLIKTFSLASLYFFCFAIVCGSVNSIIDSLLSSGDSKNWYISSICSIIGFISYFPLSFFSLKYRNNPLRAPHSFVSQVFGLLTFSFLFLFIGLTRSFSYILSEQGATNSDIWWAILFVFGLSFCIYLIPVAIGLFIGHKRQITLRKFLNSCYIVYVVLFFVTMLVAFFGYEFSGILSGFLFIVTAIILFLSPILTIYRLKTILPYMNQDDPAERLRWQNFFVFEIAFQLLQLAFHVLRATISLLTTTRSRLSR